MSAVRLARGATGRDRIVKFDGCYHGHSDGLLAGGGSGVAMLGLPGSAGVPAGAVADTVVVPYNVVPELDDRVACVIVEPVAANMNLVPPAPGFLGGAPGRLRRRPARCSIFDEVITGFRLGPGGATAWSGVTPDLWCFGKVIGGGLPVGAFGGRAALLAALAPAGPVYQAGTLSGNPLATAAGLAVLAHVTRRRLRGAGGRGPRSSPKSSSPPSREQRAVGVCARRSARWSGCSWRRGGRHRSRRRPTTSACAPGRQRRLPPFLPRHAAPWRGAGPRSLRGPVPGPGPRRGGARPRGGGGG